MCFTCASCWCDTTHVEATTQWLESTLPNKDTWHTTLTTLFAWVNEDWHHEWATELTREGITPEALVDLCLNPGHLPRVRHASDLRQGVLLQRIVRAYYRAQTEIHDTRQRWRVLSLHQAGWKPADIATFANTTPGEVTTLTQEWEEAQEIH